MEVYVRKNDTLWHYSQLFNISLPLIEQSNPGINPSLLMVGQAIKIPGYRLESYTVKPNDTLWKIATERQIPIDMLLLVNPMANPNLLQIGQVIQIPVRVNTLIVSDPDQYTYQKMLGDIQRLVDIYPFIHQGSIGQSVLGKDLIELRIGSGNKQVHVNGSFHANEWITTPVIIKFLNEYALALTNNQPIRGLYMLPLFQSTTLSAVPMVNPDGVDLVIAGADAAGQYRQQVIEMNQGRTNFSNWKANIRGVDLNNQFPARWEIEAERKPQQPGSRDYPGPYPLSEPESIAMAELTRQRDFQRVNAFHTQGEVIFWGFEGYEPPYSEVIVNEYARVSGYQPIRYVDSYAGYKDWFIQDFRRPGFTIELGRGVNPLPIQQFDDIYEKTLGIFLANLYM